MATPKTKKKPQRRNLYLFLTIACFLAIIAIFVFDGYMGVYDTVRVTTSQEGEQVMEPDSWLDDEFGYWHYVWSEEGQDISFHYELENRTFSNYSADVEVAIWFGETKHSDLVSQAVAIPGFDKEEFIWTIDTVALRPADIPETQDFEFSVIIKRDGVERRIIVHISSLARALQ
jgi:hypothetical protein